MYQRCGVHHPEHVCSLHTNCSLPGDSSITQSTLDCWAMPFQAMPCCAFACTDSQPDTILSVLTISITCAKSVSWVASFQELAIHDIMAKLVCLLWSLKFSAF